MRYCVDGWREAGDLTADLKAEADRQRQSLPTVPTTPTVDASAILNLSTSSPQAVADSLAHAKGQVQAIEAQGASSAQAAYNTLAGGVQQGTALAQQGIAVAKNAPATLKAEATTTIASLSAQGKAIWDSQNTPQANANRVAAGVVALSAIAKQKNPFNTTDGRDNVVHVTSAALSCTVILAPMAACLELANMVVHGMNALFGWHDPTFEEEWPTPASPVTGYDLACGSQPYAAWLRDGVLGVPPLSDLGALGTFRHVVLTILFGMYADAVNGKPSVMAQPYTALSAIAMLWNQQARGPMIDYYVPRLRSDIVSEQRAFFNETHQLETWVGTSWGAGVSGELQKLSQTTWSLWDPLAFRPVSEAYDVYARSGAGGKSPAELVDVLNRRRELQLWDTLSARSGPLSLLEQSSNMRNFRASYAPRAVASRASRPAAKASPILAPVAVAGVAGVAALAVLKPALLKTVLGPLAKVLR
jgi:hypothetical protein